MQWDIHTSGSTKSACFVTWLDKKCLVVFKLKKWFAEYKKKSHKRRGACSWQPLVQPHVLTSTQVRWSSVLPCSEGPAWPRGAKGWLGSMHSLEENLTAGGPLQPHNCRFPVTITGERCRMLPHPQGCEPGAGNFCFSPSSVEGFLFTFALRLNQIPGLEYRGGTGVD